MTAKVEVLKVRCPRCGARVSWAGNENRPFCSEKCRLIDLGRWADEEYRIAGQPAATVDEDDSQTY
ncbi:MAG: DNA gyrase inhibitor YacG [Trichloromonas sp.]|jgi:endogenous inhibitor of DNA gyrase (YacG/DUF329 family)|nr:DNA gyrase inhibitor YacG [Trichloromonas sp.]